MKRRRRTRRARLGSAARFVEAKTEVMLPPRGLGPSNSSSAAAENAIRAFTQVRSEKSCPVALSRFAEGQRHLGRLVEFIDGGGSGTLMRFRDSLVKASDAARAAHQIILNRCFCRR